MGVLIQTIATPGRPGAPAPSGFDDPFAMLDACHERVQRMLALLQRLQTHLTNAGCDVQAQDAARDILRYFDQAAPHHHLDEERHLVPVLRTLGGADDRLADTMLAQHAEMALQWTALRTVLLALTDVLPDGAASPVALGSEQVQTFVGLYREHMVLEDDLIYPHCRGAMDAAALAVAGDEMASRRGVPTSPRTTL